MDIKKLIAVAAGEIAHDYDGLCPDVVTGCDSRDPDCPACQIIMEAEREKQEPVFWYRPHSDGQGYDGPIHDCNMEQVRRQSGAWLPLFSFPVPRIRIEWTIEGKSGHGEWFPYHSRTTLDDYCKAMNDEYGLGSHRVVDESPSSVTAPVRLTDEHVETVARNHGTGGWQTLASMASFARAIETAVFRANGFTIDHPEHALELVGLRGCNSRHGGARKPDPCIYRMRTTDPGCTGCAERDEDQAAEACYCGD